MEDGLEERRKAALLAYRLARCPVLARRRRDYERAVSLSFQEARAIGNEKSIERLIDHNPAYIRRLLESEDSRLGDGSIAHRYSRTFFRDYYESDLHRQGAGTCTKR